MPRRKPRTGKCRQDIVRGEPLTSLSLSLSLFPKRGTHCSNSFSPKMEKTSEHRNPRGKCVCLARAKKMATNFTLRKMEDPGQSEKTHRQIAKETYVATGPQPLQQKPDSSTNSPFLCGYRLLLECVLVRQRYTHLQRLCVFPLLFFCAVIVLLSDFFLLLRDRVENKTAKFTLGGLDQ